MILPFNLENGQVADAAQVMANFNALMAGALTPLSVVVPGGGYLYTNRTNTVINRLSDRLFVGQALAVNDGGLTPGDFLGTSPGLAYQSAYPQLLVLSTTGSLAITGASRTSDATPGAGNTSIGLSGISINDTIGGSQGNSWGGYFEVQRNLGALGYTLGVELETANFGTVIDITPSAMVIQGMTVSAWLAAGAGLTPNNASSAAMGIVYNTQTFRKGIVVQSTALDGSLGVGGAGVAMEMYIGQSIRWLDGSNVTRGEITGFAGGLALRGLQATANGTVATAMSNLGPAGSHTTIQEWFTVTNNSGVTRYIPTF